MSIIEISLFYFLVILITILQSATIFHRIFRFPAGKKAFSCAHRFLYACNQIFTRGDIGSDCNAAYFPLYTDRSGFIWFD